jgi:RNA polymerase sigma-70 factor, ECF subfamily
VTTLDSAGRHAFFAERAAEGATKAESAVPELRALFETHYASVSRLLRRLGVRHAALDDAAQEVFWVAARRLGDIESGREAAFLYGVALRVASSTHRRAKSAPALVEPDVLTEIEDLGPSPEQALERSRARALLDVVLDQLPLELRTVFVLFELEGLSAKEIAELEAIPVGTASSRLRRAREEFTAVARRLRAQLMHRDSTLLAGKEKA